MKQAGRRETITLGNTNVEVNSIGLGAMPLSIDGRPNETQASAVIETFINSGGNFIDTANVYCLNASDIGHNELLIERTLSRLNKKDNVVIATKGGVERDGGNWKANGKPQFLRKSCEESLSTLKTDSIFLYQLHAPDPLIPLTDSIGELLKLKQEGKIHHIGLSNVNIVQVQIALSITEIMSVQNRYNLFDRRQLTDGVIDLCETINITFIAHSPVGGHFQHKQLTESILLMKLAKKHNASPYQIMLAWLLNKNPSVLLIPGASKISSIKDSMKATQVKLDKDDMLRLNSLK
jgi:aryl-alcohol dehydrogenase-like predicted oxidoreductase